MIDLSRLNRYVDVSHFHMETAHSVLQSLRLGDWMVLVDLQDAYLQVPVHLASRRFLRFAWEIRSTNSSLFVSALRLLCRSSPASWPRSLPSCTGSASVYSATWTIGLSSGLRSRS